MNRTRLAPISLKYYLSLDEGRRQYLADLFLQSCLAILDEIASGKPRWINIGLTKDLTRYQFSINEQGNSAVYCSHEQLTKVIGRFAEECLPLDDGEEMITDTEAPF
jgi:hypothetical protein